jgi:hypothetical protein
MLLNSSDVALFLDLSKNKSVTFPSAGQFLVFNLKYPMIKMAVYQKTGASYENQYKPDNIKKVEYNQKMERLAG